jgi:hypothetical protein
MLPYAKFTAAFARSAFLVLLAMSPVAVAVASTGSTRVFLNPVSQTVSNIGDSLKVNISIVDVSNLYGYEFKLYYNSSVMNGTQIIEGPFPKSGGQTFFRVANYADHYNSTHGFVWIVSVLIGSVSGVGAVECSLQ